VNDRERAVGFGLACTVEADVVVQGRERAAQLDAMRERGQGEADLRAFAQAVGGHYRFAQCAMGGVALIRAGIVAGVDDEHDAVRVVTVRQNAQRQCRGEQQRQAMLLAIGVDHGVLPARGMRMLTASPRTARCSA
jgi:hypothetical protein